MNIIQRVILSAAAAAIALTCAINPPLLVERVGASVVYRTDARAATSRGISIALVAALACFSVKGYPKRKKGPLEGIF